MRAAISVSPPPTLRRLPDRQGWRDRRASRVGTRRAAPMRKPRHWRWPGPRRGEQPPTSRWSLAPTGAKTPPCANALVDAGVARVVVAVNDPDPRVSGRGLWHPAGCGHRRRNGTNGTGRSPPALRLPDAADQQRPYVTLKLAVSADGMLGRRARKSRSPVLRPANRCIASVPKAMAFWSASVPFWRMIRS